MADPDTQSTAVKLFYSYAHEDEPLRKELADHLKILERRGLILPWHDRKIVPGQDWGQAIDRNLDTAELVLLLVSKDFIASDYILGVELKRAMQRQAERACDVVPILVRAVDIDPEDVDDLPFMKLQGLPTDLKAVTSWANRDEAWVNVAKGLRATVKSIQARKPALTLPASEPAAPPLLAERGGTLCVHAAPPPVDTALDDVVASVMGQIDEAEQERGPHAVFEQLRQDLTRTTRILIDLPEQKRVLWVDDNPLNNRHESVALAKLQIEVVAVRSTGEALAHIELDEKAGEAFDLVLTDWDRPRDGPQAALSLMAALHEAGYSMPVVIYHGEFDPARRSKRAEMGVAAGAMGEAVLPSELLQLVHRALIRSLVVVRTEFDAGGERRIGFAAEIGGATQEVRAQLPWWDEASKLASETSGRTDDPLDGRTLAQLLIPEALKPLWRANGDVVFELDLDTATLPWERIDVESLDPRPWAIRARLLRITRVAGFRVGATDETQVLVVGGAGREAVAVAALLRADGTLGAIDRIKALIQDEHEGLHGPDAIEVISALLSREWRVVHITGRAAPSGVLLSQDVFLGPHEFANMRTVPELVFINCGHRMLVEVADEDDRELSRFAATMAVELLAIGVRCVVCVGWPVDDAAATLFATTFYAALLRGRRFVEAVTAARHATWAAGHRHAWAAYQCYGDPDWLLRNSVRP